MAAADDLGVQAVVKRVSGRAGHKVTMCDDGVALVEEVRAGHPDV
jgi:glutathione synthase/RimK-type ligase-like ATP-grasp enzyme